MVVNQFVQSNYMYVIFWYWLTDMSSILPTSFDILFYYLVYFQQSLVYCCFKNIENFIANVIDSQITMNPTVNLQTNKGFHDRVYRVIAYQAILKWSSFFCSFFLLLLLWNFEDANGLTDLIYGFPLSEFIFLAYPAIVTFIDVTKQ